jgi:hypothetical protein
MSGLSRWSGAIALASMLLVSPGVMADDDRTLEVRPAFQETPVWCWVAVAEMVRAGPGNLHSAISGVSA